MNDVAGKRYRGTHFPVFSSDAKHFAYVAGLPNRPALVLVRDGKESVEYGAIDAPVFSPDGTHVVFWSRDLGAAMGAHRWRLIVDGVDGGVYERRPPRQPVVFDRPGAFHFLAGPLRVEVQIVSP